MKKLGEMLLEKAMIHKDELDFCLKIQQSNNHMRLGALLNAYHFISDEALARVLSQQFDLPFFNGVYSCDEHLLDVLGANLCSTYLIFPLKEENGSACVLATAVDVHLIDLIYKKIGYKINLYIGIEKNINQSLQEINQRSIKQLEVKNSMLEWVDQLIERALNLQASDIHIEPSLHAVEIRFRVNGLLKFQESLSLELLPKLVNVIFHKAEVTVSDFYHFHDARFTFHYSQKTVNIRVSHVPCIHGSGLVLRILERDKAAYELTQLGYSEQHWKLIEASLIKPDGITLIVGPTGCGKTTTLYAMLNRIKDLSKKIITIEDPVEIPLSLITQVQIHEERGIVFADSIRALLRHDPDVLLIGEVRDKETATQAMRASMTGHKVFATLHTTKAVDAVFRMIDLGVEPFLLAQSLSLVIAQRLVRTLCNTCKKIKNYTQQDSSPYLLKYMDSNAQEFYEPIGCEECNYSGFKERIVVAEVLSINQQIQEAIAQKDWGRFYKDALEEQSFVSFNSDARRLLRSGQTSLSEIVRILG